MHGLEGKLALATHILRGIGAGTDRVRTSKDTPATIGHQDGDARAEALHDTQGATGVSTRTSVARHSSPLNTASQALIEKGAARIP